MALLQPCPALLQAGLALPRPALLRASLHACLALLQPGLALLQPGRHDGPNPLAAVLETGAQPRGAIQALLQAALQRLRGECRPGPLGRREVPRRGAHGHQGEGPDDEERHAERAGPRPACRVRVAPPQAHQEASRHAPARGGGGWGWQRAEDVQLVGGRAQVGSERARSSRLERRQAEAAEGDGGGALQRVVGLAGSSAVVSLSVQPLQAARGPVAGYQGHPSGERVSDLLHP
mmetsp:Transcript_126865/g.344383  ORF Transcript_126865/g.344383 Transcript_126865/m.344383 type:complete len:234 (-) Transcript_126865:581-1282(-)